MNDLESTKHLAEEALSRGHYEAAVGAASELIETGEPWLIEGLVLRAMALEYWTSGPSDHLKAAAADWERLVEMAPCSIMHGHLARTLLKLGDRKSAFANLVEAQRIEQTPEISLGLAKYYRTASPPDLQRAKSFYLHAAVRGRMKGVRGYSETAYELNQPWLALAMALLGLAALPFIALIIGERRHWD